MDIEIIATQILQFFLNIMPFISMIIMFVLFHQIGYAVGYLECDSPTDFPRSELICAILINVAFVILSIMAKYFDININASDAINKWAVGNLCLFLIGIPFAYIFYLPAWRGGVVLASFVYAIPFACVYGLLCLTNNTTFAFNSEIIKYIVTIAGIMIALVLIPNILTMMTFAIDEIKDYRAAKYAKRELLQFLEQQKIKYNEHATCQKQVKQTKTSIRKMQKSNGKNFGFGPQLKDYLLNCGYLNTGKISLCGIGINLPEKCDMIKLNSELYKINSWYEHWSVIEVIDDENWAIVNHYTDTVEFFNIKTKKGSPFGDKVAIDEKRNWFKYKNDKLYDYIKQRVCDCNK